MHWTCWTFVCDVCGCLFIFFVCWGLWLVGGGCLVQLLFWVGPLLGVGWLIGWVGWSMDLESMVGCGDCFVLSFIWFVCLFGFFLHAYSVRRRHTWVLKMLKPGFDWVGWLVANFGLLGWVICLDAWFVDRLGCLVSWLISLLIGLVVWFVDRFVWFGWIGCLVGWSGLLVG